MCWNIEDSFWKERTNITPNTITEAEADTLIYYGPFSARIKDLLNDGWEVYTVKNRLIKQRKFYIYEPGSGLIGGCRLYDPTKPTNSAYKGYIKNERFYGENCYTSSIHLEFLTPLKNHKHRKTLPKDFNQEVQEVNVQEVLDIIIETQKETNRKYFEQIITQDKLKEAEIIFLNELVA